jgi:hypothetical protein
MSDATPDPAPSKPFQDKVANKSRIYTTSTPNTKTKHPSVDVNMDDAKPQRARADVDSAEMLLGLRKVS